MIICPLDPRKCNVAIDANSLDRPDDVRAALVDRLVTLYELRKINLIVPKGVRVEFQHIRTPSHVKEVGLSPIFTLSTGLNQKEKQDREAIELELQGNAKSGKHKSDADHLFEAGKYCAYFITHDKRILNKVGKLSNVLPPSLTVVTLADFLKIFDEYDAREDSCNSEI